MLRFTLIYFMLISLFVGCAETSSSSLDDHSSDPDTTEYSYQLSSDFDLEISNSTNPKTWFLKWNENENSEIYGVLVGDWGSIPVSGAVDSERTITFASSKTPYGANAINLIYFILPAGELKGSIVMTADAYNDEGHFYNAQLTAQVN